jgi:hypothetical protein
VRPYRYHHYNGNSPAEVIWGFEFRDACVRASWSFYGRPVPSPPFTLSIGMPFTAACQLLRTHRQICGFHAQRVNPNAKLPAHVNQTRPPGAYTSMCATVSPMYTKLCGDLGEFPQSIGRVWWRVVLRGPPGPISTVSYNHKKKTFIPQKQ